MNDENEKFISPFLPRSFEWEEDEAEQKDLAPLQDLPLFDETDKEILMHRDAHFSGSFGAMLDYYAQGERKGVCGDFDMDRIAFLSDVQKIYGRDMAPLVLSGSEAERVAKAKKLYRDLLALVDEATPEGILAEYILSEEAIEDIVKQPKEILLKKPELLLSLLTSDTFFDPLSPGYGQAPILAIELLGKLQYEPALSALFSLIGQYSEEIETAALSSLRKIGQVAKEFGMRLLRSRPITNDTERAALLLTHFLPDMDVQKLFEEQLADPKVTGMLREYLRVP